MVILIGHHEVVRTLLQGRADVNAKDNVRKQMMMMILLTIMMMMIMIMLRAVHPRYYNKIK